MRLVPDKVPMLLRRAGVVGAGGAGFPSYVKYQKPTKTLIANCTESEPGYWADKLLMRDRSDVLSRCLVLLRETMGYERVVVAVKKRHATYAAHMVQAAEETGAFEMAYVPDEYMMGEEKTLTKFVTGEGVPKGAIPPHVGVTVQNTETLYNIYWALTEHRPVTRKFVQTIGEVTHGEVLEVPVGTLVADVWRHIGVDPEQTAKDYRLIDGGPLLGDLIEDPLHHAVRRTTNGLLTVHPDRLKGRGKHYPGPGHEPPAGISVMADEVDLVEVPLGGGYGQPATPVVSVGSEVTVGQEIGAYDPDELSVSVHASIPGVVTGITDQRIRIERQE